MEKYKLELSFDQCNTLIFSGIYNGLDHIERNIAKLAKENPETPAEEWRRHYEASIFYLKTARIDIEQQLFDQGNTNLGRDWKNDQERRKELIGI